MFYDDEANSGPRMGRRVGWPSALIDASPVDDVRYLPIGSNSDDAGPTMTPGPIPDLILMSLTAFLLVLFASRAFANSVGSWVVC